MAPSLSSSRRAGAGIARRALETSTLSAESRVKYGRCLRKSIPEADNPMLTIAD
jgi:hypothetical protein